MDAACYPSIPQYKLVDGLHVSDHRSGGYLDAVQSYLAPLGLCLLKVKLTAGKLDLPMGTASPLCLLTGKSPRGQHSHAVVARVSSDGSGFDLYHDPHPSGGGIDGNGNWAGFIVSLLHSDGSDGGDGSDDVAPAAKRSRGEQSWRASLQLQEDPSDSAARVTLSVDGKSTKEAATAALAQILHQRVFNQPIATNEKENFNDYTTPVGFIESIRREHASDAMPESMTAASVWEALYDAICTMTVEASG